MFNTTLSSSKARMERTMAYSRMVLNTMKMQVMMNVSMAFSFDSPEDGALERTLLKTLTRTRRRMTRRDIRPGTTCRGEMVTITLSDVKTPLETETRHPLQCTVS